jgi:AcrR family transcriptional regulator
MARTADPHARSALIAAARKEFVRFGIKGARIEDITQASGLSKGAFYLHFESKEALFGELVNGFTQKMESIVLERERVVRALLDHHRDSQAVLALEVKYDREVLEHIWNERDVFAVLSRGAQGTAFEGLMWQLADREMKRVMENIESMKLSGTCRLDAPAELFGSLVVGTYLLMAQRMTLLEEKPDLDSWVLSLQRLIHEGLAPRPPGLKKRRPVRPPVRGLRSSERSLS